MINRELIRIKIVQLTYAYYQNGNKNIETAEKELLFSLSKAYDLYNYLLVLIVGITKEARRHLEVAESRAKREGTPMPSTKFVYNRFALQLENNAMLNDFIETQKKNWDDEPEFLKKIYTQITESQIYKDYMESPEDDYASDRELWRKLYRTLIQDNSDLDALLEEQRPSSALRRRTGQRSRCCLSTTMRRTRTMPASCSVPPSSTATNTSTT